MDEVVPGIVFDEIRFRSYRGAEVVVHGQAERATFRRDTGEVTAERVIARFPARDGKPAHVVEAARGEGNLQTREARLHDAVITRGGWRE